MSMTETENKTPLADTGNRTTLGGGAKRDLGGHKGRCDLLPLDIIGEIFIDIDGAAGEFFFAMNDYIRKGDPVFLLCALDEFIESAYGSNYGEAILEVAKQYEDGAKKYADRNWEKNMPIWSFCDSAIRHYIKWFDGWDDEPHDRAVVWNLLGALWTHKHFHTKKEEDKENKINKEQKTLQWWGEIE